MAEHLTELMEQMICSDGSLWLEEERLVRNAKRRRVSLTSLQSSINNDSIKWLVVDKKKYYTLSKYDEWETLAAYHAIRILTEYKKEPYPEEIIDYYLNEAKKDTGITLHEQQRAAVIAGLNNGFCVITGGPGTGKTCTLTTLTYVLRKLNFNVDIRFTAPTGKAARRITESTKNAAKTVQKELGITPTNHHKRYFGGDALIVDEVSMLDMETAKQVFEAVQSGQKLLFVGDIDQLPSVGPGAVLRDLIFSEVIPVVQLTKTFRQANDSNLFCNILKIRDGDWQMKEGEDFEVIKKDLDPTEQILQLFMKEVSEYGIDNVACLLPYRRAGELCSNRINTLIQQRVNPIGEKPFIKVTKEDGRIVYFSIGDPVMQQENRDECANGDVGKVIEIQNNKLIVSFIDGTVAYSVSQIEEELELAYSMSINKSQGSEYKCVVMAITEEHKAMLKRNLVYTGVTRAKERCVLLQEDSAMMTAIATEEAYERITFFAEKLAYYYNKLILKTCSY